ncbi:hypothetical protein BDL97_02G170200 [Sphagnum fallax]|nr:hypothetical protein BDL97_02G170200 [Sphagnum fallax]
MRSLLQPMRFYVQYEAVKKNDDEGNDAAVPQDQKNVVLKLLMNHHAKKHSSMNIVQYLSSTATASKGFTLYSLYYMLSSFWIILSIALQIYYLGLRFYLYAEYPIDVLSRPWLLVILFCECFYLCGALFSAVDHLLPPSRRPDLGSLDVTSRKNKQLCPTVDVFIPCCNEPTDVPIESVKAALALDYPQDRFKVFVLDDGADDELRAFCQALQVGTAAGKLEYIRRIKVKGVPHHFKCGNMNNGLKHSNAEYVVMMDADMILQSSFLRRTLPHIVDAPDVAFVQIPQSFYNLPIGDPLHDSCVLGYNRVLLHRDTLGTTTCVGTGTLFRRKCLDAIGGFQPQSITEDTMTAYMLFNQGYKSVYINEKLQFGLTPWTFEGFVKQRTRWGTGAMQQFAASWKTCLIGKNSKLNFVQKVLYIDHTAFYFMSFNNALLATVLLACLAFDLKLSVGTDQQNLRLIECLAMNLIASRIAWICLWCNMPQSMQMRNRDESMFWWMTPYYIQMCLNSIFHFNESFSFVPTSNIDSSAAAIAAGFKSTGGSQKPMSWISCLKLELYSSQLKLVRFHLVYVIVSFGILLARFYHASGISANCSEKFLVIGLAVFFINTAAHMLVPVVYILCRGRDIGAQQRKSLLRYDANGVPQFVPQDGLPKWSWSVLPYEILSTLTLLFWIVVLILSMKSHSNVNGVTKWCKQAS